MDEKYCIDILKTIACCTMPTLHCSDCPMWNEQNQDCHSWVDDEHVVEAVKMLNSKE